MLATDVQPSTGGGGVGAGVRTIGRYALHSEIASGGMATVYFGRLLGPVGFSRTVAVKQLHPHFSKDPDFVAMFLDEARVAARIHHPNVIQTVDVVVTGGELFLVMDYLPGESLARLLRALTKSGERIPVDIACTIMSNVLHGLHAAHEAKDERGEPLDIVHRDVSPSNVMVGVDGVARVLDFGVAKAVGSLHTTREGSLKGKLAYMAPEQIEGTVTRQSDIYAAAVVLWEALTGRRLFEGEEVAVLAKVLGGVIPPPSSVAPGLSKSLDELTLRGLARQPEQRFATAREMALALEACATFTPPSKVGEWVSGIAAEALARRRDLVAAMESVAGTPAVPKGENPLSHLKSDAPRASDPQISVLVRPPASSEEAPGNTNGGLAIDRGGRWSGGIVLALLAVAVAVAVAVALGAIATAGRSHASRSSSASTSSPVTSPAAVVSVAPSADPPAAASVPAATTSASVAREASAQASAVSTQTTAAPKPRASTRPVPGKPGLGSAIDSRH